MPPLATRTRPGRPRHVPDRGIGTPREQILEAAARLFTSSGFAATSTREIAEAVGIRQASLYYHFAGKDDILAELLEQSVRPSLDEVEKIERECPSEVPGTALYLLVLADVCTLATAPHNIGKLYRMPDVSNSEGYARFRSALRELTAAYGRLGAAIANDSVAHTISVKQLGCLLMQLVEVVISLRAQRSGITASEAHGIAASCLRTCGLTDEDIRGAASAASGLMPAFAYESTYRSGDTR